MLRPDLRSSHSAGSASGQTSWRLTCTPAPSERTKRTRQCLSGPTLCRARAQVRGCSPCSRRWTMSALFCSEAGPPSLRPPLQSGCLTRTRSRGRSSRCRAARSLPMPKHRPCLLTAPSSSLAATTKRWMGTLFSSTTRTLSLRTLGFRSGWRRHLVLPCEPTTLHVP